LKNISKSFQTCFKSFLAKNNRTTAKIPISASVECVEGCFCKIGFFADRNGDCQATCESVDEIQAAEELLFSIGTNYNPSLEDKCFDDFTDSEEYITKYLYDAHRETLAQAIEVAKEARDNRSGSEESKRKVYFLLDKKTKFVLKDKARQISRFNKFQRRKASVEDRMNNIVSKMSGIVQNM